MPNFQKILETKKNYTQGVYISLLNLRTNS